MTNSTTTAYDVSGMSCGHCEAAVREEVDKLDGIRVVSVDAGTGTLLVDAEGTIDDAAVIAAVDEAGYSATRAAS